jgi:multiple sugar transport system ATP-binding protein
MAFGLKIAKAAKNEIDAAVRRAAEILNIEALLDRKPAALSGGQRQRVAIGRAIVRQPQIFLFDEPLSNLDADLRVRMRYEFASLHRQLGTTTLYVTHDQVEAMTLADRIIVLRDGRIEQIGTPRELYERPANIFVAQFLGTPRMNMLSATVAEGGRATLEDGRSIALPPLAAPLAAGTPLSIGIRPEDIVIGDAPDALPFTIRFIERLGGLATLHLGGREGDERIACQLRDDGSLGEGDTVFASLPPSHLHLFGADGQALRTAGE